MQQYVGRTFCFCNDQQKFEVEEADRFFFICRYCGTEEGFVMEKEVFDRQFQKGRIQEQMMSQSVAV